jgi:bifunctional non-homologous end joining protein LigD
MVLLRERISRQRVGAVEPCLPSPAKCPPAGPEWIHEIKHDGFRLIARQVEYREPIAVAHDRRRRRHGPSAVLCAFDLIEVDGHNLRRQPIEYRKRMLAKVIRCPHPGVALNEYYEGDGEIVYKHACKLGCEGIVSKRLGSLYRSGRSPHWVKVKNPAAPAVKREAEEDWS